MDIKRLLGFISIAGVAWTGGYFMSGSTEHPPSRSEQLGENIKGAESRQIEGAIFNDPAQEASTNVLDVFVDSTHGKQPPQATDEVYDPELYVDSMPINDPLEIIETEGIVLYNDNTVARFDDLDAVVPQALIEQERQYSVGGAPDYFYEEPLPDILYDEYAANATVSGNDTGEFIEVMPLELIAIEESAKQGNSLPVFYQEPLPDNP